MDPTVVLYTRARRWWSQTKHLQFRRQVPDSTYLDELAMALLTNTATKTTVTAKHNNICNEQNVCLL